MAKSQFIKGVVAENHHWTNRLYSLKIKAKIKPFTAGQFGRLALDLDSEQVARPYSFVNSPDQKHLEFYSIVVKDGPLSPHLAELTPGDTVWVANGGNGFLVLDEVPDGRHLWLLSTGTGLGPFLSILKTATPWQRFEKVILIHAVRQVEELTYRDTITSFAEQHGGKFVHVPFVSREQTDFAISGRIPAAIENGELEKRGGSTFNADDSQVMLCGNPAMLKDVVAVLQSRGLTKNRRRTPGNITVESYW